jgi:hypothetical protein
VARVEGMDASAAEAAAQLGVDVTEPASTPAGFVQTSSRVFASGVAKGEGGLFALTYAGEDSSSLAIYQERAAGGTFTAQIGHTFDVSLSDGTAATYVEGFWQPVNGTFVWSDGDGQGLIFERNGVRTSIQYRGPSRNPAFLFTIADSLSASSGGAVDRR